jgi:hypothetical protein
MNFEGEKYAKFFDFILEEGEGYSSSPSGMTTRTANATTMTKAIADPYEMTAKGQATVSATADPLRG